MNKPGVRLSCSSLDSMLVRECDAEVQRYLDLAEPILQRYMEYPDVAEDLAEAWITLSQMLRRPGDTESAAERLAHASIALENSATIRISLYWVPFRSANISTREGDLAGFSGVAESGRTPGPPGEKPQAFEQTFYRRARSSSWGKATMAGAEPFLQAGLAIDIPIGGRRYIALGQYRLAEVYAATGHLQAAQRYADAALHGLEGLGIRLAYEVVKNLLAKLKGQA